MLELGDRAAIGPLTAGDGLAPYPVELPAPPPQPIDTTGAALVRARAAYSRGELEACRSELAHLDVAEMLAASDRASASRSLALDIACAWAATLHAEAETHAQTFASYGLDLPETVLAPDVEAVLGTAIEHGGEARRHALAIRGAVGTRLVVDGRPAGCALPCTLDLAPGPHVLAVERDGYVPAHQVGRVPDVASVSLDQALASPELAARQWRARIGRGQPAADAIGAALVGRFVADRRVVVLHAGPRLTGELVVAGARVASKEGTRAHELVRELAYDGGVLHRPEVWQRPLFWIVTTGAAIVVAGAIVAVTYQRPISTSGGF
ncbi:hypothetical protein BH11MYX1_BH11MYX1_22790 [soil metagenome]